MFNWFKKSTDNVVQFPVDYIQPPVPPKEEPAKIFYRIGVTDQNSITFSMGMTELTMTRSGVQALIEQLQVFRDQLAENEVGNES